MSEYIAVLDADSCIYLGKPISEDDSFLNVLLNIFNTNYIHKFVFDEIDDGTDEKTHLNRLCVKKLIDVVEDKDILELYKLLSQDEEEICSLFNATLRRNIELSKCSKRYFMNLYKPLFDKNYTSIVELETDLKSVESTAIKGKGLGEIKTAVLIETLATIGVENINIFVSNDNKARNLIVTSSNQQVFTCSVIGSFVILRDAGMPKEAARKYFNQLDPTIHNDASDSNGKLTIRKSYPEFFDDIFNKNVGLTVNGYLKYLD